MKAHGQSGHRAGWSALMVAAGLTLVAPAAAGYRDATVAQEAVSAVADSVLLGGSPGASGPEKYFVCFRFEGLLWLYGSDAGTRVCGPTGPSWPPTAGALLGWVRQGDPGIAAVSIYRAPKEPPGGQSDVPNGCVIACLAQLVRVVANAGPPDEVGLVLFYYARPGAAGAIAPGVVDHAILVYRRGERWWCRDPRQPAPLRLRQVAVGAHLDPTLGVLAGRTDYRLEHARLLVISPRTLEQVAAWVAWRTALRHAP